HDRALRRDCRGEVKTPGALWGEYNMIVTTAARCGPASGLVGTLHRDAEKLVRPAAPMKQNGPQTLRERTTMRPQSHNIIPIIDVSELVAGTPGQRTVAARLGEACRESGFFYAVGHGVNEDLQVRLRELSRQFFAQDVDSKLRVRMALGGRAWRGYF